MAAGADRTDNIISSYCKSCAAGARVRCTAVDTGCVDINDFRERLWCGFGDGFRCGFGDGFRCGFGDGFRAGLSFLGWVIAEVGGGDLEDVGEESGSFEVHAVGGEQGGEFSEGVLDGGAGEVGRDLEGLVFVDGRDGVLAVGEAHVVVVHGAGAAAAAVGGMVVHALVRDGWFAAEVVVAVDEHGVGTPGVTTRFVEAAGVKRGSHTLVNR
jgi:hypothetical protein